MSVKILGAGAMGSLVGHELARSGRVAPVLLFRFKERLDRFSADGSKITVVRTQDENVESSTAVMEGELAPSGLSNEKIQNLVVSTKSYATIDALKPYVPYLDESSNVLILQNGMGMAEKLKGAFWAASSSKIPTFYEAISTHGAYKPSPNIVNHVGLGKLTISPAGINTGSVNEKPELVKALLDCHRLNACCVSQDDMLLTQMEKLIVNACINPLSALLDCLNGDLLYGSQVVPIMKRVIAEALDCFGVEFGKRIADIDGAKTFLNRERLLNSVLKICKDTAQNSSSMREDVRHMRTTEVEAINGYIWDLGKKHSVPTPVNRMLVFMVQNKVSIERGIEKSALEEL
ncbi:hypothetical protein FT663_04343 [Candidozyma haemuli var. vulneris]|nr:hypothetical protein FT662_04449 [[Candida] haemuloni var. vulneris]KAF3987722.1 hypothetical protein FT663_04343 [[Candida] haemuloni var. vulneris]